MYLPAPGQWTDGAHGGSKYTVAGVGDRRMLTAVFTGSLAEDCLPIQVIYHKPVDLGLTILKELGAKWFIEMADYFANNPQMVVNGFVEAAISGSFDDVVTEHQEEAGSETEGDFSTSDKGWSDEETDTSTVV